MPKLFDVVQEGSLELEVPSLTRDELEILSQALANYRVERFDGTLYVMSPITNRISAGAGRVYAFMEIWCLETGAGQSFNCDAGFFLPDGSALMPDAAFISAARYQNCPSTETDRGWPEIVPDFVCEVRSRTDKIKDLQLKLDRWMRNGVLLAWLIDPLEQHVWVYRPGAAVQELGELTGVLSGEAVLPGFTFDLALMRLA